MALSDLRLCLGGHVDLTADIAPIRALLEQGCVEADALPVIALEVAGAATAAQELGRAVACSGNP
jgi:hypothetical protein